MIVTKQATDTKRNFNATSTRNRIMASTMSVDEYFDELIDKVREDDANSERLLAEQDKAKVQKAMVRDSQTRAFDELHSGRVHYDARKLFAEQILSNIVKKNNDLIPLSMQEVEDRIAVIRNQEVIADADVAYLYGVETREVNQAVKNNPEKFPAHYMFELTPSELRDLKSKVLISNVSNNSRRGATKAFTERGLYNSLILRSTLVACSEGLKKFQINTDMAEMTKDTPKYIMAYHSNNRQIQRWFLRSLLSEVRADKHQPSSISHQSS